jgi:CBS domain-containing protein/sporulation protein YlmC with PRC-barrel domain
MAVEMAHDNRVRFLFFSDLLGKPVVSADGQELGRLSDLIVIPGEPYPPVESIVIRSFHRARLRLLWASVAELSVRGVRLLPAAVAEPLADQISTDRLRVAEELLDRQIVDVEGAKVVRVNDLHFLEVNDMLRLAHVDVGFRGLVRRMGWERGVDRAVTLLRPSAAYLHADSLLSWKLIQPLGDVGGRVRLDVAQDQLATLHPADLAEILEELDHYQRTSLFKRLTVETAAEALEETSPEVTAELLDEVPPEQAAEILEEMDPDEAADVLGEMPQETRSELLEAMDSPDAQEVQDLLRYDPRSAGGLMTPNVIKMLAENTAQETLSEIRSRADELHLVYEIFVVDAAGVLQGECTLKDLLIADPTSPLGGLMREPPGSVLAEAGIHEVAEVASKYSLLSVPVVKPGGELIGIVTVDDILPGVLHGS